MGGLSFYQKPVPMKRLRYNRANGSDWAGFPYSSDVTVDQVAASGSSPGSYGTSGNSGSLWNSIVNNVGGWLSTIGQTVTGSVAAKNPPTVEDNTPKVLAIAGVGVAAVVLIIALLIIFKK